uniref:Uncharacterized protein n=1 Tax=Aegilops tauschii TaxID=37682 RepID=R7WCY7_AEGTA
MMPSRDSSSHRSVDPWSDLKEEGRAAIATVGAYTGRSPVPAPTRSSRTAIPLRCFGYHGGEPAVPRGLTPGRSQVLQRVELFQACVDLGLVLYAGRVYLTISNITFYWRLLTGGAYKMIVQQSNQDNLQLWCCDVGGIAQQQWGTVVDA